MSYFDHLEKLVTCIASILVVSINYVDETSALSECSNIIRIRLIKLLRTWEIFDLKLDMRIVIHWLCFNLLGAAEEECFMRAHLLEDHALNTRLATFWQTH